MTDTPGLTANFTFLGIARSSAGLFIELTTRCLPPGGGCKAFPLGWPRQQGSSEETTRRSTENNDEREEDHTEFGNKEKYTRRVTDLLNGGGDHEDDTILVHIPLSRPSPWIRYVQALLGFARSTVPTGPIYQKKTNIFFTWQNDESANIHQKTKITKVVCGGLFNCFFS